MTIRLPPGEVRREETRQEVVGKMVDCESQFVSVGALARADALDSGVQHQRIDRRLAQQPRRKSAYAIEAREIDKLQFGLLLEGGGRGVQVPRCHDQQQESRPSTNFAASRPMPAVAPVITIRMTRRLRPDAGARPTAPLPSKALAKWKANS
jgi:hypothetical protein